MQTKDLKTGTLVGYKRGSTYGDPIRCVVLDNRRWKRNFRFDDYKPGDGKGSGIPLAHEVRATVYVDGKVTFSDELTWKFLLANPKDILGPWDEVVERTAREKEAKAKYQAEKSAREDRWRAACAADKALAAQFEVNVSPASTAYDSSTDAPYTYSISRVDLLKLIELAGGAS